MAKTENKLDTFSIIIGVLIALGAQGIYDGIFYYAKGDILEDSIVILITAMVILLTATIIFTAKLYRAIKRKPEPPTPPTNPEGEQAFDRELELEKIRTVKKTFQNYFNIGSSILTGGLTALVVLIITLFFSNNLNLLTAILELIGLAIIISIAFYWSHRRNIKFLRHYDGWIKKIQKGEPLPCSPLPVLL